MVYSLRFGEIRGVWLGCRCCQDWHHFESDGGTISAEEQKQPLESRYCLFWSNKPQARRERFADASTHIGKWSSCVRHRANLSRTLRTFLDQHGAEAEKRYLALHHNGAWPEEEEDDGDVEDGVVQLRRGIAIVDKWTDKQSLNAAFRNERWEWYRSVQAARNVGEVATLVVQFVEAHNAAGKAWLAERQAETTGSVTFASMAAAASGADADGLREVILWFEERLGIARHMAARAKKAAASKRQRQRIADLWSPELLQQEAEANARQHRGRDGKVLEGPVAITLSAEPQLAQEEMEVRFSTGLSPRSDRGQLTLDNGFWPWRTDAHAPPVVHLSCMVWALLAVVGLPSVGALLGGGSDEALKLAAPNGLWFQWLQGLRERHALTPIGALEFRHLRGGSRALWEQVLAQTEGVFLFICRLRRTLDQVLLHVVGYNAGTRVLYLGPWVRALDASDVADAGQVAHSVYMETGIFMDEEGAAVRQVYFNPRHAAAPRLPFNVGEQLQAVRQTSSISSRRRGYKKQRV